MVNTLAAIICAGTIAITGTHLVNNGERAVRIYEKIIRDDNRILGKIDYIYIGAGLGCLTSVIGLTYSLFHNKRDEKERMPRRMRGSAYRPESRFVPRDRGGF